MCGTRLLLAGMQEWLADQGIPSHAIGRNGTGWRVQWSHRDSLRLAELMYGEPGPFLARKRDRFRRPVWP
jgi:hypothetical protein